MSEHSRGEICGAVRAAALDDLCPLPPHGDELAHDGVDGPWREVPLDTPRQPHPVFLDRGCGDGITSSVSLQMRTTEVRHG